MPRWDEKDLASKLEKNPGLKVMVDMGAIQRAKDDLTISKEGLAPLPLIRGGEVIQLTISKYRNRRTSYGGQNYHSQKEANRARDNDLRIKAGELSFYLTQVPIRLPGGVVYRLDFVEFTQIKGNASLYEVRFIEVKPSGKFREKTGEVKRKIAKALLKIDIEVV